MSLILNIDTATETASICLSKDEEILSLVQNKEQKDHASWLQVAIAQMMHEAGYAMRNLEAIAVTAGPGSYTGLRVGMSTAKGLCYALNIPLITENTLKVMAQAAKEQTHTAASLLCPMIDARRMEVFTALYTPDLEEFMIPTAMVLDEHSFADYLAKNTILFFGSGSAKWKKLTNTLGIFFAEVLSHAGYLAILSCQKMSAGQFTDVIYSEPAYTKEFHTHNRK